LEIGRQPPHLTPPPSSAPRSARLLLTSGPLPRTNPAPCGDSPTAGICRPPLQLSSPAREAPWTATAAGSSVLVVLLCGNGRRACRCRCEKINAQVPPPLAGRTFVHRTKELGLAWQVAGLSSRPQEWSSMHLCSPTEHMHVYLQIAYDRLYSFV
jgi:hypothetical protein